jgi:rare lipoprotein A (peptidoglycan hydrolase)
MKSANIITILLILIFVISCTTSPIKTNKPEKKYFTSSGFALIYEDNLFEKKIVNKKISNDKIYALHSFLKTNTTVKLTNPTNSKFIITKIYKKAEYPNIFNILISQKVASVLELDVKNPYLEITEVKKNETFIAKESNIFDEEKNVAEKAPVDEVLMNDLNPASKNDVKEKSKINFLIVINDFYYFESAKRLKMELTKKLKINYISIKKINDKKYRLFAGPFKNFNTLKTAYISLNNLGFNNLNIYKK